MFQVKVAAFILMGLAFVVAQDCQKHPPHVKPHECCKMPESDAVKDAFMKCKEQQGGEGEGKEKHKNFPCIMECAMKELGWMEGDKADRGKMMTMLQEHAGDNAELKALVEKTVSECVTEDGEPAHQPPEHGHHPEHESKCNKKPMHIFMCMGFKTIMNCPESMTASSDKCTEFKNHMEKCKPQH